MKTRTAFVSNSSSSSFVISLDDLTAKQLKLIETHEIKGPKVLGRDWQRVLPNDEIWDIDVSEKNIHGRTGMDNFSMQKFLEEIGIDMNKVRWNS